MMGPLKRATRKPAKPSLRRGRLFRAARGRDQARDSNSEPQSAGQQPERAEVPETAVSSRSAQPTPSEPAWLSVVQLCRRWQLDRKTIYKFIDAEILPSWKVSSHLYRISLADVLRFESQNRMQRATVLAHERTSSTVKRGRRAG